MQLEEANAEASVPGWQQSELARTKQFRQALGLSGGGQSIAANLYGRTLRISLSPNAYKAAAALSSPLTIELELLFSCLVRKTVRFHASLPRAEETPESHTRILEQLHLQFSPVTTQHCSLDNTVDAPPLERMPLTKPQAFLPHWVKIDYRRGQWLGEFGY